MSNTPPLNATILRIALIAGAASGAAAAITTPVRVDARGIGSERFSGGKRGLLSILRPDGVGVTSTEGTLAVYGADLPNPLAGQPLGNAFAASTTPTSQLFAGDGTTLAFQTNIPYAAFSNNNWIVETQSFKFTGTFTISAAGVITGSSTLLTTEAAVGDTILVAGRIYQIATITSATAGTVTAATAGIAAVAGSTGYNLAQRARIATYGSSPSGPRQFSVTNVGGYALITFAVAPPAELPGAVNIPGAQGTGIAVYLVTPVEVLADGKHINDRVGIRNRTVLWVSSTPTSTDKMSAATVDLEVAVR